MDEATASLDPDNEVPVQQALSALVKHKTVIMIAHRLYTVSNAHQIIVLEEGKIAEQGTHQQLLNNRSLYAAMRGSTNYSLIFTTRSWIKRLYQLVPG